MIKKFSVEFQYLCQKKFYDGNWDEGSSIFNALKVGKNIGFLPAELFPYVTEEDRKLPYDQYIAKLQAIPDAEIERLKTLCTDKLAGYAKVPLNSLATGISSSKAGILVRYDCGPTWWIPSWLTKDINPLRKPISNITGHALTMNLFNLLTKLNTLANTWGITWNKQGCGDVVVDSYPPTEAWIPYYTVEDIQIAERTLMQKVLILLQQLYNKLRPKA